MRVDADDFARPCGDGKMHHEIKEILIEPGAVNALEEAMSEGFLKEYISPLLICDTNTCKATEKLMEDIFDRCQVLVLDADDLQADQHAIEIVENYMDEDIDLILAVGSGTVHDISRYVAFQYKIPFISVPTAASAEGFVSTEAEMVWNGQKKMIAAEAPIAVYADTDIFANAPTELNLSGAIRVNSSDTYLTERKISETQIKEGDPDTCEKLMYVLVWCCRSGRRRMIMRVGMGYDVHKLTEGRKLILGGVDIPWEKGLLGHSDADVLIHAVMDALLGAAALGDIGKHFPDTDPAYKGISSIKLLVHVAELLRKQEYAVGNIDATVIAQKPKMAPHIPQMRKNMADALGIPESKINIKATTEEGLGFTGRGEGIASQAICLLIEKQD